MRGFMSEGKAVSLGSVEAGSAEAGLAEAGSAVAGLAVPLTGPLPGVRSGLLAAEILSRLNTVSRRGKLAGYVARGAAKIEVAAFGEPFDHDLRGVIEASSGVGGEGAVGGSEIRFSLHMRPKLPVIYVLLIAVSVWPGVWLTHSMLVTYFSWYTIQTWWWYIPLTVGPLFWMVPRMITKSRVAVRVSALEQIKKIGAAVDGVVVLP